MKKIVFLLFGLVITTNSYAAISLDRTRAIYEGGANALVININNDNKQLPYLAQTWIENDKDEKIETGPLIATPLVQRLDPGDKGLIKISTTPDIDQLPNDRETLFYFNVREVPPKSEDNNVLQIALHTKIKLFYRPKEILREPNAVWQDQLILNKVTNGYKIDNPTPYYITLFGIGGTENEAIDSDFDSVMIAPKSSITIKSKVYSTPYLSYINDYGGRPTIKFKCQVDRCVAEKK
ncbi:MULTISPECIES: fimbrial biogenesis chaperone [Providencia]|uniref:Fimbria/pilus periplasmic chaperone n=2 Tax=Providencia TaxID=586 RepID=A0AAI9DFA1_PROST|nr:MULTISPECIES: fimbria/pilus periplasmic chaperone [Providencia]ELR5114562.1 fimbria/pilus periplasmic chaperone [Providencia stuartii]MDV5227668.1 fimbria/pilus periplasmic chaperone [Providencia rettgeri]MDX4947382.1 fimbria/pilus periplasmic chaperone [Providencia manganoxydans]QQO62554.1 fimbria/pilus periplasmic chaperone [Providencia manganoxydans]HEF8774869.1 fimbria/pilus periplasmic chaperone [Providencia stuartii]